MLILNHEPQYASMPFTAVPYCREEDGCMLRDVRGSLHNVLPMVEHAYVSFMRMFGKDINLATLIKEDWKFRLSQKRNHRASIKLTFFHPKYRYTLNFKLSAGSGFENIPIKFLIIRMTQPDAFQGMYSGNNEPLDITNDKVKETEKVVEVPLKIDTLTNMELIEELNKRYKVEKTKKKTFTKAKIDVIDINNAA